MQSSPQEIIPLLGTSMGGGFYAGRIRIGDQVFALIVAPKAEGERDEIPWNENEERVTGALAYDDGYANTLAMAEAGSEFAQWARSLRIGGFDDWYLPSQDEMEVCYRNLKPTTRANYCYARSGINLAAVEPTRPYTPEHPVQTSADLFQEGGAEAFAAEWYWSSTQRASASDYAWHQDFTNGYQLGSHKSYAGRARAVRRLPL